MIIDCHVHLNNYHNDETESLSQCLDKLRREMRKNRIDVALILTSYKVTPGRPSTHDVVRAVRDDQSLYVVAGMDYDTFQSSQLDELVDYVKDGKVRGLKMYPGYQYFYPADPKFRPVFEFAAEHDIPVMIHSGDTYAPTGKVKYAHPLHVDDVAVDHPNVNIVICHIGNPWIRDCMEVVYKNKNVCTDISGLVLGNFTDRFEAFMQKQLQEMLLFGVEPTNVLFGTDWPISSMESYIEFMDELKIPEKDRRKIMYENSARIFKIPVNGPASGSTRRNWLR